MIQKEKFEAKRYHDTLLMYTNLESLHCACMLITSILITILLLIVIGFYPVWVQYSDRQESVQCTCGRMEQEKFQEK